MFTARCWYQGKILDTVLQKCSSTQVCVSWIFPCIPLILQYFSHEEFSESRRYVEFQGYTEKIICIALGKYRKTRNIFWKLTKLFLNHRELRILPSLVFPADSRIHLQNSGYTTERSRSPQWLRSKAFSFFYIPRGQAPRDIKEFKGFAS